jgi:hypothetical protein
MNQLTLAALLKAGKTYVENPTWADYLVVWVEGVAPEPEIIVNPISNLSEKLDYYARAYNEELVMKANHAIWMADYCFVTKLDMTRLFA